ncbi:MAG TPA: hemerythrin domain-containing protein [Anaeromyxobacter sp.]|nr:hemerythrin domain-containing protein [Anaeromyxobacter sp.]
MLPHDPAAIDPSAREGADRTEGPGVPARRERAPEAALVAHIVERHHGYARRSLPYVVALLAKVAASHGRRNAKLGVLCDVGEELAELLEGHLEVEERELFPALLAGGAPDSVREGLDRMARHHRALELLLARTRWLADDFAVPDWGGRAYQALMEELEALEEDVLEHMHLERIVLGARPS